MTLKCCCLPIRLGKFETFFCLHDRRNFHLESGADRASKTCAWLLRLPLWKRVDIPSPGRHSHPHITLVSRTKALPAKRCEDGYGYKNGWDEERISTIAPHEMTSFLNLSSCWILFIGYQVPRSTQEHTNAPTAEGGLIRNLFHQLQQRLPCGDTGCLPLTKKNNK